MRILQIFASGLPLFKEDLNICFFAQQRVGEADKSCLFECSSAPSLYAHTTNVFIGVNASGKTSILKTIRFALAIVRNEPLNHVEEKIILGGAGKVVFRIWFLSEDNAVYCLETEIHSKKETDCNISCTIVGEKLWRKALKSIKSKKNLTNFLDTKPVAVRKGDEPFLLDDVSFIIAHNKKMSAKLSVCSFNSYTDPSILLSFDGDSAQVIKFLDPTIESLQFEKIKNNVSVHLKFYNSPEIVLNDVKSLDLYLSSGTIKGIMVFAMARQTLQSGGYFLIDEIENHFNKEIVSILVRFFRDTNFNKKGGVLIFSTHYPELLDEYDRNDGIFVLRNNEGISIENLSTILKRNDVKKSDAYQSGLLEGTTPSYDAYLQLKKSIALSISGELQC